MVNPKYYRKEPVIKPGKFEQLYKKLEKRYGSELTELLEKAKAWHNPMNYDDGSGIRKKYGWKKLFTDRLHGKRYYFPFHDLPDHSHDTILAHFIACKKMVVYLDKWYIYAPREIMDTLLYITAIVEMTYDGMSHEQKVAQQYKDNGHSVRVSTSEEDYSEGIDLWVDNEPVQVKSPATQYMMDRH